jgi:hypothetical protein
VEEEKGRIEWLPYKEGKTIGQAGSENGVILHDEEYPGAARITLERDGGGIPYAITCGIYDWMVHTTFGGDLQEMEQRYEEMKVELVRIWDLIPYETDPEEEKKRKESYLEIHAFVNRY